MVDNGNGIEVGSLPDLSPDSDDLEEVGESIEAIAGHKLVRRKKQIFPLLQVLWDNGATSWEPIKHLKKDIPCMVATYINVNKLGRPYHRDWAARVIKKKFEVIAKMRRAAGCSDNVMYGIKVPKSVKQALEFDKQNGDTFWEDSIKKEMKALFDMDTFKCVSGDTLFKKEDGWQFAPLRMIMEIKRDLRRKSRLVIGSHVTDTTGYDCYAATIRTENVRLIVYMVVRIPLSVLVVDIGNAYLNAL